MLTAEPLPVATAGAWVEVPACGAVCTFVGTVRDHADGRRGVTAIDYEAYEEHVLPAFATIAGRMRSRWPDIGRMVLWHRIGRLELGAASVVVAVSAPHRGEAFEACRFGIDTLKASAPIWKKETWTEGSDWSEAAAPLEPATAAAERPAAAGRPPNDASPRRGR